MPLLQIAAAAAGGSGSSAKGGGTAPSSRQQAAAQPPAAQQQQQQQQQGGQQQFLYEGKYGLPVVRRKLGYSDLLRAVRMGEVSEVHFFTLEEDATQVRISSGLLPDFQDGGVGVGGAAASCSRRMQRRSAVSCC